MRFDCQYDLVLEIDYPLGESSDLAHDTWARDLEAKVQDRFAGLSSVGNIRAVRSGDHLKMSMRVLTWALCTQVLGILLGVVMPQAPEDIVIKLHEVVEEEAETTMDEALWTR